MTMASEFLMRNKTQIEDYNQIKHEVKQLIEDNSSYHLKNIHYDGVGETGCSGWFVELMDYNVSIEIINLLHNYFGGKCFVTTGNISNGGITIVFQYNNIEYVQQNWENETLD